VKVILYTVVYSEFSIMIGPLLAIKRLKRLKIIYQFIFSPRGPYEVALVEVFTVLTNRPPPSLLQYRSDKGIIISFPNIEFSRH